MRYRRVLVAIATVAAVMWAPRPNVARAQEDEVAGTPATSTGPAEGAPPRPEPASFKGPGSARDAIKTLGVTEGEPVGSGFVFVNGRYLEPPYTVSRRGVMIVVNSEMVYPWTQWPLPDLRVDEDPGMPEGLNEDSTFKALTRGGRNSHMAKKQRYLYQHFGEDTAQAKILEYYRQLPCVSSAAVARPGVPSGLIIRMKNGQEVLVNIRPPHPDSALHWDFSNEMLARRLDAMRQRYETRLVKGDCFLLFSNGQELSWGRKQTARDLGLVVEILRSGQTNEEKTRLLQRMEVLPPPVTGVGDRYSALVTGFQAPPELDDRIRKLVAETGVTPRRLGDIPDEIPFERMLRLQKETEEGVKQPQE